EPHSGFDPAGEVGGLVLQQAVHRFGRERHLIAAWRRSQSHLRASTPNDNRRGREVALPEATRGLPRVGRPHDLGRLYSIHRQPLPLLGADRLAGQGMRPGLYTHISSPAPTPEGRCLGKPGVSRTNDGLRRSAGKIFPGFMSPWGSNTRRIRSITSRSASEKTYRIFSRFSRPMPCSPVTDPPASAQSFKISSPMPSTASY